MRNCRGRCATDYAQGTQEILDKVPDMCARRGLELSMLHGELVSYPPPKVNVGAVCPEAGEEAISSGFEPAKLEALVTGRGYRYPDRHPSAFV